MPGALFLDGDEIELRTVDGDDVDFLHDLVNDPRIRRGIAALDPITRSQERKWVEARGKDGSINFIVAVAGETVGTIGLKPPNDAGVAEVGYMIAPSEWGNGYATDALRTMCGYAFDERGLHKVYANVYETNPASSAVLEKVGFEKEGHHREQGFVDGEHIDVLRYGLLVDEWKEMTAANEADEKRWL
ncbi:GNAT family N-acetyltransferase [Haloferax namakaokahaiae]|uniref:GNAT family N-acetyltransferase n=1 Tax=Haloferax namakaokahaiae TaxID=1748331 RepID=A0ABD5ZAX7_9EURY